MNKYLFFTLIVILITFLTSCSEKHKPYKLISKATKNNLLTKKPVDNINGISHIRHKHIDKKSVLSAYIIDVDGSGFHQYLKIAIEFQYFDRRWIFFKTAIIEGANGERFNFKFSFTDHTSTLDKEGNVKEYASIVLNQKDAKKLLRIVQSSKVKVKLSGLEEKNFIIDKKTQNGIVQLIEYYLKNS